MNCSPTLSAEEFKVLHNTLWELSRIDDRKVQSLVERIRTVALKGAYAQDHAAFETKHSHYDQVRESLGLRSTWSIYDIDDLSQPHPYVGAAEICYEDHWGEEIVYQTISGTTWAALYAAADAAIRRSGDGHHVFIEHFEPVADLPQILRLTTGS